MKLTDLEFSGVEHHRSWLDTFNASLDSPWSVAEDHPPHMVQFERHGESITIRWALRGKKMLSSIFRVRQGCPTISGMVENPDTESDPIVFVRLHETLTGWMKAPPLLPPEPEVDQGRIITYLEQTVDRLKSTMRAAAATLDRSYHGFDSATPNGMKSVLHTLHTTLMDEVEKGENDGER